MKNGIFSLIQGKTEKRKHFGPIHIGRDASKWSQVPFVRVMLRCLLLSVQCEQDCCYNRICGS